MVAPLAIILNLPMKFVCMVEVSASNLILDDLIVPQKQSTKHQCIDCKSVICQQQVS